MKRHNSDNRYYGGGHNKRYRTDTYNDALAEGKYELRLLIPTKTAGAVIGKGGEYIKNIREKVFLNCFFFIKRIIFFLFICFILNFCVIILCFYTTK